MASGAAAGLLLAFGRRQKAAFQEIRGRDGLAAVGLAWPLISLAGALPYWFSGLSPGFVDALFESVSGFSTTGATLLTGLDQTAPVFLLWRSLSHWLGGMGVIVLMLAVLPFFGLGGLHLFKNDSPLGEVRLKPRISQTAMALWLIYLTLTLSLLLMVRAGGLSWFDSLCHAFSAIATGGFSNYDLSIGHYQHPYLDVAFTLFMFLSSLNFALYYRLVRGDWRSLVQDPETRFFTLIIVVFSLFIAAILIFSAHYPAPLTALRHAAFQVVSVTSTAGLSSSDTAQWPRLAQGLLLALFLLGGCSGSTSGGVKCVRWILIFKGIHQALRQHIHPRAVFSLRLGNRPVPEQLMYAVWSFTALYLVVLAAAAMALAALGLDLATSFFASAAALGNVGLGLGLTDGLTAFPAAAKAILILEMMLGRLEFFTILILFLPEFWER